MTTKIKELRALSSDELLKMVGEKSKLYTGYRLSNMRADGFDSSLFSKLRKEIAQIYTILNERKFNE
jgi:ribosomal protein L29